MQIAKQHRRIRRALAHLERAFGKRTWARRLPALDQLVCTLLSQNTTDLTSLRAFDQLKRRFKSWEEVAAARPSAIEKTIRVAGLAPTKTKRIKEILQALKRDRGGYSLEFLADLPMSRAMDTLCGLPGIGPKTAACTLLFSFGLPAFPVDTHIHRVSKRLGLVPQNADRVRAQETLQGLVPEDAVYPFHLLVIELGRAICHARNPKHADCPLRRMCPSSGL